MDHKVEANTPNYSKLTFLEMPGERKHERGGGGETNELSSLQESEAARTHS